MSDLLTVIAASRVPEPESLALGDPAPGITRMKEMAAEARAFVEEHLRLYGTLPKWELFMKDPAFRAAVEAADDAVARRAAQEIMQRTLRENDILLRLAEENSRRIEAKAEGLATIEASVGRAEQRLGEYKQDPNGFLLLGKLATANGAALEAIASTPPYDTDDPRVAGLNRMVADLRSRLERLAAVAESLKPEDMEAYIKSRRQELGFDRPNKKQVPQEGQVGADVEMQLGGLRRAPNAEIEFVPGPFSPYQGADPTTPHQIDVFGPTPEIVRKVVLINARRLYPALTAVPNEELLAKLFALDQPGTIASDSLKAPVQVDPQAIWDSYLGQARLFDSLDDHFAKGGTKAKNKGKNVGEEKEGKPTIVPFDSSGLGIWPGLLAHVQREALRRFSTKYHLILWYDVAPRK